MADTTPIINNNNVFGNFSGETALITLIYSKVDELNKKQGGLSEEEIKKIINAVMDERKSEFISEIVSKIKIPNKETMSISKKSMDALSGIITSALSNAVGGGNVSLSSEDVQRITDQLNRSTPDVQKELRIFFGMNPDSTEPFNTTDITNNVVGPITTAIAGLGEKLDVVKGSLSGEHANIEKLILTLLEENKQIRSEFSKITDLLQQIVSNQERSSTTSESTAETGDGKDGASKGESDSPTDGTTTTTGEATTTTDGATTTTDGATTTTDGTTTTTGEATTTTGGATPTTGGTTTPTGGDKGPGTAIVPYQRPGDLVSVKKPTIKRKVKVLKKSREQTAILKEPHRRPWFRRIGHFATNHPILTTLIGLGIGVGVGAAAIGVGGLVAAGGFASMVRFFAPTFALTGGIGLGTGLSASIASRIIDRKEVLRRKFSKKYRTCAKIKEKIEDLTEEMEDQQALVQTARENNRQKKGFLKKIGYYKMARNFHKKRVRQLRQSRRNQEARYDRTAEQALSTKAALNARESKPRRDGTDHSTALAGYLRDKKKVQNKYGARIAAGDQEAAEDYRDAMEDVQDAFEDHGGVGNLEEVADTFRTYDREALDVIAGMTSGARGSQIVSDIEQDILTRNSVEHVSVAEEDALYDPTQDLNDANNLPDNDPTKGEKVADATKKYIEYMHQRQRMQEYDDYASANGLDPNDPTM